ncbi:synaptotagmin-like protein 2-like, partial [Scleropages formosus]
MRNLRAPEPIAGLGWTDNPKVNNADCERGQKGSTELVTMIDLSYLTEQEQEMIKAVLKRDAALKRVEEERVKKLQRSLRDRSKLKYFTGEWFYETKSRRHRDRIHGSDIIRASLSQKKPITLLELTQMWEERPSFVNSGNKEVFVPAELSGLLEEPAAQPLEAREHSRQQGSRTRHNPFNEAQVAPMAAVQTDGLLTNGAVQMVPTSEGEFLLPPKNNVVSDTVINSEGSPALCGTFSEPVAEPKKRTVIHTDLDSPRSDRSCAELHSKTSSPRGFLKHSSSDSSSDMTNPRHDSPSLPHSPSPVTMLTSSGDLGAGAMFTRQTESVSSPDSEQVGFSWVATSGSKEEVELQRACEPGEHYLLDVGNPTLSSFEQKSSHIDTCSPLREGSNDMIHSRVVHEELVKAEDLSLTAARTPANPSSYPSVWTAMVPPCGGTVLHTSQSQNRKLIEWWKKVGIEEESESIAKVLEWFTWSSNSSSSPSDEDEENQESYQLDFKKAKQHPGMPADIKTHFTSRDVRDFTKSSPIKHMTGTLEEKLEGERLYKAEICYSEDVLVSEANPIMPVIDSLCLHTELVCQPKGCLLTAEERQKPEEQTAEEQIFEEGVCDEDITNVSATKVPQDVKSYEAQEEVPQHKVTTLMSFWEQQNRDPKVLISRTNSGLGQTEIEADQQTLFTHEDMAPSSENTDNVHEKYMPETDDIRGGVPVFPPQITRSRISADIEENIEQVCLETGHPTSPKEHFVADSALKTMFSEVNSLSVQSSRLSEGQNEDNFGYTPKSIIVGEKDSSSTQDLTTDSQTRDQKEGGQLLSLFKDSPFITQSNQDPLEEMTLNLQQDLKGKIGPLKSFWEKEKSSPTIIAGQSKNSSYSKSIDEYLESSQCQVNDRFNTSSSVFGTTSKTLDSDDFISSQCSIRPNFTFQQIELSSNFKNVCDFRRDSAKEAKVENRQPIMKAMKESPQGQMMRDDHNIPWQVSTAPATPSSSFSDPDQMKRMSMSVPVFVQEENGGRDSDSESSGRSDGQRRTGSSFTNLSASSGVPSVSSQVSGSVMSIYSGDFGSVDVKGTIQFAISYVQKLSEMHIFVVQCRNLAIADIRKNRSDPYVKCYLFPDKAKLGKRKTSVKKKTVNPTYNEILRYRVDIETLRTQTMNLSVWHNDTFGRNSFMGEVDMDLSKWDFSNTQMRDYTLKPRTASGMQPVDYRGEMRVALRFLNQVSQSKQSSKTGEVQIWVKDCKNLPMIRGAAIDPFVKCTVLPDPNKKSRQKTRVLKRTADPQFNHTMVHEGFGPEDLKEACVELTVWDHDRLSNHFIGGLRLGLGTGKSYGAPVDWMDCSSDEAALWERMMDCHNEWVEDVLPLRMLVMAR